MRQLLNADVGPNHAITTLTACLNTIYFEIQNEFG